MEYQVNINYSFMAANEAEAKEKAQAYINNNLEVKAMRDGMCNPLAVTSRCKDISEKSKEHFCVFFLDTHNGILDREIVSVGTLNSSIVHPRECFRTAIKKNSASVIFVHNHPSGSLEPSQEDITVTKRLVEIGKLLGIEVMDHVIVTSNSYTSFKERNLL